MRDTCEEKYIHEKRVQKAKTKLLSPERIEEITSFYKLLGDPTRLKICLALTEAPLCVCDLSLLLKMTDSAISHQLRLLKQAHILKSEKKGKMVYYHLADHHIYEIVMMTKTHLEE